MFQETAIVPTRCTGSNWENNCHWAVRLTGRYCDCTSDCWEQLQYSGWYWWYHSHSIYSARDWTDRCATDQHGCYNPHQIYKISRKKKDCILMAGDILQVLQSCCHFDCIAGFYQRRSFSFPTLATCQNDWVIIDCCAGENIAGTALVNKLLAILLMETDFNFWHKHSPLLDYTSPI